ncbi:transcriptional regulator [Nakamurella antarctica]|uniref:Transcriptional regulator n=2 Tax=Nakamurella antarctica TaxID=1902245 RepID=A0A3G8ZQU0_9ACTN|nr:transcriptional regulator [Nakamurella antarctica]
MSQSDPATAVIDGCVVPLVHPEKVALAREAGPSLAETIELAGLFKLLGDPTRTRILYSLLEAGELCVCDISATVSVAETTVSQALRLLRTAGVVACRRDGRMMFYRLADAHVRMLLDLSREHARHESAGQL